MKSRYLDGDEVQRIRAALAPHEWLPLWISLETGIRVGDVVALKCGSVRYDGIHYTAQKTGKRGLAPISQELRQALRRGKAGEWLLPSPYRLDRHLTRQAVWDRIKRGAKVAGVDLEGVSPHALRKSFAVELYREKGFKAVQAALQHRNAATTEIYSFADWSTGENADKPLCRRDLQLVVKMVLEALGGCTFDKESQPRKRRTT